MTRRPSLRHSSEPMASSLRAAPTSRRGARLREVATRERPDRLRTEPPE
jgi:hypothetical protein